MTHTVCIAHNTKQQPQNVVLVWARSLWGISLGIFFLFGSNKNKKNASLFQWGPGSPKAGGIHAGPGGFSHGFHTAIQYSTQPECNNTDEQWLELSPSGPMLKGA